MASEESLLQYLRSKSSVDIDSLDVEVAKSLGPFVDCTSNQAIAYFELLKPEHKTLIHESLALAKSLEATYPNIEPKVIAVEIAMVKLSLRILPYTTGRIHIQVNPYYSYSAPKIISNARRIIKHAQVLSPGIATNRICIKIPSTYSGLLACCTLEKESITTLATTLFTMVQAQFAAEMRATYIAPYVNELKVHFEEGFIDANKAKMGALCAKIQRLYRKAGMKTQVLPASLTSAEEVMELAGVDHLTLSPAVLGLLKAIRVSDLKTESLVEGGKELEELVRYGDDEEKWRMAFTRGEGGDGEGERKLVQAINIFCDMQDKMEGLMV